MSISARTKQVKMLRNIFGGISFALWIGTLLFFVITIYSRIATTGTEDVAASVDSATIELLSKEMKDLLLSVSTTAIIGVLGTIIIKDKIRTFIWMLNLIMGVILYKEVAMYTVLAIWFIEEYVIHALYLYYKNAVQINKEIDRRE